MDKPYIKIRFAQLREIMSALSYRHVKVSDQHVAFADEQGNVLLAMPIYKDRAVVMPHHLSALRGLLENHGVLDGDEFDRRVEAAAANTSVS